jgi:hypothetical protein
LRPVKINPTLEEILFIVVGAATTNYSKYI